MNETNEPLSGRDLNASGRFLFWLDQKDKKKAQVWSKGDNALEVQSNEVWMKWERRREVKRLPGIMNRGIQKTFAHRILLAGSRQKKRETERRQSPSGGNKRRATRRVAKNDRTPSPGRDNSSFFLIHVTSPQFHGRSSMKLQPFVLWPKNHQTPSFQETGRKTRNLAVIYGTWNTFITALYLLQTGSSNF